MPNETVSYCKSGMHYFPFIWIIVKIRNPSSPGNRELLVLFNLGKAELTQVRQACCLKVHLPRATQILLKKNHIWLIWGKYAFLQANLCSLCEICFSRGINSTWEAHTYRTKRILKLQFRSLICHRVWLHRFKINNLISTCTSVVVQCRPWASPVAFINQKEKHVQPIGNRECERG